MAAYDYTYSSIYLLKTALAQLVYFLLAFSHFRWICGLAARQKIPDNLQDLFLQEQSEIRKFALAIPCEKGVKYESDNRNRWLLRAELDIRRTTYQKISINVLTHHDIRQRMPRNVEQYADQGSNKWFPLHQRK
ncbi:hypothetical protein [Sphingobacterium deserti]|uniref:Uncharacterized protein n=1 Tax=Sphingobacterium deserti TaxID=1229276 RepID=A0A0B8TAF8_9SPHI|nr:hypothetical protein [Sphingobacterium deserti]KGE15829.1 hypothetical protein DI53_0382 [Sphingobacterium deserti]